MQSVLLNSITSTQNPKVKAAIKLKNKRQRDETSTYLIEGYRELSRAESGGAVIESVFVCPEFFLKDNENQLISILSEKGATVFQTTKAVFEKLSYRDRPDGLIAVARKNPSKLDDITFKNDNPFVVVAVSLEKPGNLGTILRSADAVGADAIIVVDRITDVYNPNVVRASVGTLFTQTVVETSTEEILDWLKAHNIQIVATSPGASQVYTEVNYKGPVAIIVGCEQYGLPQNWLELAESKVFIPMCGTADSLNAATCTTLMLYEVLRQRQNL